VGVAGRRIHSVDHVIIFFIFFLCVLRAFAVKKSLGNFFTPSFQFQMPKIAQLTATRNIVIKDRVPLIANENEVIIAVETAGICGTDLALFSGDYPVPLPLVCGHEFVGTVKSIGDGADKRWLGRRVTAEINNTCKAYNRSPVCHACKIGMPGHCQKRTVTGIIHHDGAFAEEVAVAVGTLHEIPENMESATAALTEPLAAALQTFEMSPVTQEDTVVVIGPGRLGILIVFAAALKGCRVIAVSRSEAKRQRSMGFGAFQAFSPEQAEGTIREITGGLGGGHRCGRYRSPGWNHTSAVTGATKGNRIRQDHLRPARTEIGHDETGRR